MAEKKITMLEKMEDGSFDTIYPKTTADQVVTDAENEFISNQDKTTLKDRSVFTSNEPIINPIGDISAGETFDNVPIPQMLQRILYKYTAPTITCTTTPAGGVFEKGTAQNVTKVSVRVTKKSMNITKVEVKAAGASLGVKDNAEEVKNGGTFDFAVTKKVYADTTFSGEATDGKPTTVKANASTFTFVDPFYYGSTDKAAPVEADITGLTKIVQVKGNKTFSFTTTNNRMVIAYPKAYGALKSILDPNNFENLTAFTQTEVNINRPRENEGGDASPEAVAYFVYTAKSASSVAGFNMTFKF